MLVGTVKKKTIVNCMKINVSLIIPNRTFLVLFGGDLGRAKIRITLSGTKEA